MATDTENIKPKGQTMTEISKAVESANKNLDNALTVAVDALKQIADCSPNKTYSGTVAQQALTKIAAILKVRQKD